MIFEFVVKLNVLNFSFFLYNCRLALVSEIFTKVISTIIVNSAYNYTSVIAFASVLVLGGLVVDRYNDTIET